jgi:hypothetical protein
MIRAFTAAGVFILVGFNHSGLHCQISRAWLPGITGVVVVVGGCRLCFLCALMTYCKVLTYQVTAAAGSAAAGRVFPSSLGASSRAYSLSGPAVVGGLLCACSLCIRAGLNIVSIWQMTVAGSAGSRVGLPDAVGACGAAHPAASTGGTLRCCKRCAPGSGR